MTRSLDSIKIRFVGSDDFTRKVVDAYDDGSAELGLPADETAGLSWVPAGTGALRDFSNIAPDLPVLDAEKCVGCMECVTQCPDTA
ncbi:MAG TPA: 4Fe-4S binding protein, partial [Acidiferrobacterales bacterium]|nr:4Fe-4S binding protein [Acidiferrobacterales bacterium]